jgi:4'-phosphopantetheinyl transferase
VPLIQSLPDEQRRPAFFDLWTLKEAYVEARGLGFSIPLVDFAFAFDPIRIAFSPRIADHPANWFFWQDRLSPSHVLAIAARRQPDEHLGLRVREVALESLL